MRKLLSLVAGLAFGLLGWAAQGTATAPAKKKSAAKKTTHSATAGKRTAASRGGVHKSTSSARTQSSVRKSTTGTAHSASARHGKKAPVRTTWRNRQLAPSSDRYKQIQEALSAKGYLPAEQANGQWTETSAAALKKFQADQNLDASGKINSLSLIALGLGPKHDDAVLPPPPAQDFYPQGR